MIPIQPRALKVEGGTVVHVQGGDVHLTGHRDPTTGIPVPDGTYLHIDYVTEVIEGYEGQLRANGGSSALLGGFRGLREFFRMRAL